jgi:hypothetical protein
MITKTGCIWELSIETLNSKKNAFNHGYAFSQDFSPIFVLRLQFSGLQCRLLILTNALKEYYRLSLQAYSTLHVLTFQKTDIFIFTAMRTLNIMFHQTMEHAGRIKRIEFCTLASARTCRYGVIFHWKWRENNPPSGYPPDYTVSQVRLE